MLTWTARTLKELAFPPTCSGCGERGTWLCPRCAGTIPAFSDIPTCCVRCGLPPHHHGCGCKSLEASIVTARSGYPYRGWVERAIRGAKYEHEPDRAVFLGSVLAISTAAELITSADYVVPVPMHRRRARDRGYNQAERIAFGACEALDVAPPVQLLTQLEERPTQVGLTAGQRRDNVIGAFDLADGWVLKPGARIVVVDDVRTTGSTLSACADALRSVRAARIDVITVAAELSHAVSETLNLAEG